MGDFFTKELLSTGQMKAENKVKAAAKQGESPSVTQPSTPNVAVASLPKKESVSESSPPAQAQSVNKQEILIETIIPRDLRASHLVSLVMQRMKEEIIEIFVQRKVKSPEKLAELYLSKIQSDILPSGEKVSFFRLRSKELTDLPHILILTEEEKRDLEKEKWELIRTRKSPTRLRQVLTLLRDGYKVIPQ